MKKVYLLSIIGLMTIQTAFADNDKIIFDKKELPESAIKFIDQHFSTIEISLMKAKNNFFGITSYDIVLTDGTDLEFNRNGEWIEVDCGKKPMPEKIVPPLIRASISKIIKGNYFVIEIEKESPGYKVKLSNGVELIYDSACRFIKFDD